MHNNDNTSVKTGPVYATWHECSVVTAMLEGEAFDVDNDMVY